MASGKPYWVRESILWSLEARIKKEGDYDLSVLGKPEGISSNAKYFRALAFLCVDLSHESQMR